MEVSADSSLAGVSGSARSKKAFAGTKFDEVLDRYSWKVYITGTERNSTQEAIIMDQLPFTLLMSHLMLSRDSFSALPDAPVVPYVRPVSRVRRTRASAASLLHHLGDVVAPSRPGGRYRTLG
jgi:hypothetical protein